MIKLIGLVILTRAKNFNIKEHKNEHTDWDFRIRQFRKRR